MRVILLYSTSHASSLANQSLESYQTRGFFSAGRLLIGDYKRPLRNDTSVLQPYLTAIVFSYLSQIFVSGPIFFTENFFPRTNFSEKFAGSSPKNLPRADRVAHYTSNCKNDEDATHEAATDLLWMHTCNG